VKKEVFFFVKKVKINNEKVKNKQTNGYIIHSMLLSIIVVFFFQIKYCNDIYKKRRVIKLREYKGR
jgi:sulfur relay (sulfurtransferase) complex TusBCD TusD component (DsrE family)